MTFRAVMMFAAIGLTTVGGYTFGGSPASEDLSSPSVVGSVPHADQIEEQAIDYVRRALDARSGGRIDFEAESCRAEGGDVVSFPSLKLSYPQGGTSADIALRNVFAGNRNISIKIDKSLFRITIGRPGRSILRVRLKEVRFSSAQQYSGIYALAAVLEAPEVSAWMKQHAAREPMHPYVGSVRGPDPSLPHLPARIQNVTVDQALDMISRTFDGIVLYGACEYRPLVDFNFVPERRSVRAMYY